MNVIEYTFWACAGIIFYNYFGYGILLVILTGIKQLFKNTRAGLKKEQQLDPDPEVTIVVAAYNEGDIIEYKIRNCLGINYPSNKLSFLFITDGSNDDSTAIIQKYPQIKLLHQHKRKGKTAALNRAMTHVTSSITIFCDANTMLNKSAVKRIVSHYKNKNTGGVAGEKKVISGSFSTMTGTGESLYWKYESFLKKLDAEFYTVTGAAGELFSIRTILWDPLPENIILDDFVISTRINLKGYRIAYEPWAYAWELPSTSLKEERKRKIRISAGAFQAMVIFKQLFNFFKHPILFFQFFSHRFLRWTLTPLSLPILFITNILLVLSNTGTFFYIVLTAQITFYLLAIFGTERLKYSARFKILKICHYILFMNYSVYLGLIRFLRKEQSVIWEKATREPARM